MSRMTPEKRFEQIAAEYKGDRAGHWFMVRKEAVIAAIADAEADMRERCATMAESFTIWQTHGIAIQAANATCESIAAAIRIPPAESEVPG